ncbi:MAG: hypothetical protein ACFFBH_05575 [Promethearchaeota archaeon]
MKFKTRKWINVIFLLALNLSILLLSNQIVWKSEENYKKDFNFNQIDTPSMDLELKLNDISISQYSGIGKAQNITEYGFADFPNNGLDLNNNDNASIIVPEDWKANEVICNISNIYDYDSLWVNETFNTGIDLSHWSNYTKRPQNVTFGWYNNPEGDNDSIYIRFEDANEPGTPWNNFNSYVNYTFNLPRYQIPYQYWDINFKYWASYSDINWMTGLGGAKVFFSLYVNGISQSFSEKLSNIADNEIHQDSIPLFTPEQYGMALPGKISLKFGVNFGNSGINPSGFLQLFYDNITLSLSTLPKPSDINLNINDITNDDWTNINDIGPGEGTITLKNMWEGDIDGRYHLFGFSSNSSGRIVLNTEFFVKATSQKQTKTQLGFTGSEFQVDTNTKATWTMYFTIIIPGTYSTDYYLNVTKPTNWNVTQLINPYGANKINDVLATAGYGNSTLKIPNTIVTNGIWKVVVDAPNYVEEANIYRRTGSYWAQNNTFYALDDLKVNGTINTASIPNLDETNASLKIYYSNGTLMYQEDKILVDADGIFEFSKITIGVENITCGKYSAQIIWTDHDQNASQVGIKLLKFNVIHKTSLIAIDTYLERIAGESFLLKVKFIDSDLNASIAYGTITYSSTFDSFGMMTYQPGVYISEINTDSLDLGNYYFSFNASKSYYENQTSINLVQLKILAQPLALETPKKVISGLGNDYISCQINVTGASTGTLISQANISTNWQNPYFITDYNNGTYSLNFSTWDLPKQGIIETYTITIFANKSNYQATTGFIAMTIFPIQAEGNVNRTSIFADLNEVYDIRVNYTVESSGTLILGANCTVSWDAAYKVITDSYGFVVRLNTTSLSVKTYAATIKLQKAGYTTIYKTIIVNINNIPITVNTMGFKDSLEAFVGEVITIKVNLTESNSHIYIENATVFYSWRFGNGYFDYFGSGTYELELRLPVNIQGSYRMNLTISKENSLYEVKEYSFVIVITQEVLPQSNVPLWFVVFGLIGIIGIFGIIGLRSYVILPRKRKKESELLAKTQKYRDVMNIEAITLSMEGSGLGIYSKSYFSEQRFQDDLLGGFIQAITMLGERIVGDEHIKDYSIETPKNLSGIDRMMSLDFRFFNVFICENKDIRIVFILKKQASERLKAQTSELLLSISSIFSEKFEAFNGDLDEFNKKLPQLLDEHLQLYYKEYFKLTTMKNINRIKQEGELNKMELRLLNVIISMTNVKPDFYLKDAIEQVHEKKKDLVIKALESLIEKSIVLPLSEHS